jgi:MOSC domain-containing protein YiiM
VGDEIEVLSRPEHGVTVALVSDAILRDDALRPVAAAAPELAVDLARYLRHHTAAA